MHSKWTEQPIQWLEQEWSNPLVGCLAWWLPDCSHSSCRTRFPPARVGPEPFDSSEGTSVVTRNLQRLEQPLWMWMSLLWEHTYANNSHC